MYNGVMDSEHNMIRASNFVRQVISIAYIWLHDLLIKYRIYLMERVVGYRSWRLYAYDFEERVLALSYA